MIVLPLVALLLTAPPAKAPPTKAPSMKAAADAGVVATDAGVAVAPMDPAAARARAALGPYKKTLKETLVKALEQGPDVALDTCSKNAQGLATKFSKDGVTVGRSALRLRNEKDAPRPWLGPVMVELSKAKSETDAWTLVDVGGGKKGYAEAIWLKAECLTCHGDPLVPSVEMKLKTLYPKDAAKGFHLGEFRGVFWAEVDAPAK